MLVSTVNFIDLYIDVQNLAMLVLLPRVNQCWLVAQYICLEFKKFARIWLLKMLSFWCQKYSLSLSIPLLLEVLYMEQPDDGFLIFFLLNMCAPRIMAFLVPVHFLFIQEFLIEGFVLKNNVSTYSFVEAALIMRSCGIFGKAIFGYFS